MVRLIISGGESLFIVRNLESMEVEFIYYWLILWLIFEGWCGMMFLSWFLVMIVV